MLPGERGAEHEQVEQRFRELAYRVLQYIAARPHDSELVTAARYPLTQMDNLKPVTPLVALRMARRSTLPVDELPYLIDNVIELLVREYLVSCAALQSCSRH